MRKLILLDAYALIFRAYYALIRSPRINSKRMNTSAIFGFVNTLEEVLKKENPDFIGVAFDPKGGTFRHEIYPEYKAQREETPEDIRIAVPYIKKILEAYRIPVLEIPGYEADDVIGTLATKASQYGDIITYMMTPDKDYGQLVKDNVKMLRPRHGSNEFELLGPSEVCEKYGIQSTSQVIDLLGLMGDASDNVPGCPGVGEKTAVKLINDFGGIDQLIARSSELKGALKQKVENNVEGIRFSKLLVTIKTDVPIELDLDLLSRKPIDIERLKPLFEELEFRSLLQRVGGTQPVKEPQKKPMPMSGQLDLFATYEPQETTPHEVKESKTSQEVSPQASLFDTPSFSTYKDTPHTYHLIDTDAKINDFIEKIAASDVLCFDTETTSTEAMTAELVGMSFAIKEGEAYYVPVPADRAEAQRIVNLLKPIFENPSTLKVGQNMKYDIIVLSNYHVRVQGPMFDTMIAHYILKPEMHHNMDYMAETKDKKLRRKQLMAAIEMRGIGLSYVEIGKKIGMSKSSVHRMLLNFDPENINEAEEMKTDNTNQEKPKGREQRLRDEIAALKAELKAVRKELDYQTIRGEVLDELINMAERDFKIDIRKKDGAKR